MTGGTSGDGGIVYRIVELVALGVAGLLAIVHWVVTRWRLDGDTLRIETGLLRRDSRQLPVSRIQAVDVVRPFLARVLGVSELRVIRCSPCTMAWLPRPPSQANATAWNSRMAPVSKGIVLSGFRPAGAAGMTSGSARVIAREPARRAPEPG
jgi:hypothetical protein